MTITPGRAALDHVLGTYAPQPSLEERADALAATLTTPRARRATAEAMRALGLPHYEHLADLLEARV